jgi:hypothetical protein
MNELSKVMSDCVASVPECLAAGFVDMTTGMLLGLKTVDSHPQEILDLVAAAAGDLFQGPNVSAIEQAFKRARGLPDDGHHYLQQVILNSDNLLHVFYRGRTNPDNVLVVVCRRAANLGMVLAKAKALLARAEAAV